MNLYGINGGEMGVGIDSRSASFIVQPWCTGVLSLEGDCVNGTWVEPTFTNLRYGVLAGSFVTHEPFSVRGALFTDNLVGIKSYGNEIGPSIVQNTFHVSPRPVSSLTGVLADASVGVLMRAANGFELEENEFVGEPSSSYPELRVIGAAFVNTVPNDATPNDTEFNNECYKNSFDKLDAGVLALGKNGGFSSGQLPGLQFLCNTFGENDPNSYGDIVVGDNSAIKSNQGADIDGNQAGNLFSHLCPNGGEPSDIVMGVDANNIVYWYGTADTAEEPICYTLGLVNPLDVLGQNTCASKLSRDASKVVLLDDMDNTEGILIDTKSLYLGLLDCGDRQVVLDAINDPQMSSMEVRNAMLNCSPYISDSVFTAAFNRIPALSPWHMAQVLLANSPLSPAVKQMMYDASFDPYYEQLVLNGQNGGPTHKTILESDIAYLQGELSRMRQDYLRLALLWDEDEADWGDAVARLEADSADTPTLIGALFNKGDLIQADTKLQSLPKTSDEEKSIYAILESRIEEKHCPRYTPTQLALLQGLADDYDAPGSAQAYAALMPVTGEVVDIPLPFPTAKRLGRNRAPEPSTTPFLKLFPNPANDVVNLVFKAPDPETRCRFILEDNQGRRILELNDIRNGIAEFSVGRLPSGMYFGRLIFDNTVIATEKITVVR